MGGSMIGYGPELYSKAPEVDLTFEEYGFRTEVSLSETPQEFSVLLLHEDLDFALKLIPRPMRARAIYWQIFLLSACCRSTLAYLSLVNEEDSDSPRCQLCNEEFGQWIGLPILIHYDAFESPSGVHPSSRETLHAWASRLGQDPLDSELLGCDLEASVEKIVGLFKIRSDYV